MARIMAIDYGLKRTGIAVTDPLQIIASALTTVESAKIFTFLDNYLNKEKVELILVGDPRNLDDTPTNLSAHVQRILGIMQKKYPAILVKTIDERYSSVIASRAMVEMGMKKSRRREKGVIDQVAATMILQEYLTNLQNEAP
jgi:putative Holliday junction resolvase